MTVCTIDVSNEFLYIGIKHLLKEILDEITHSRSMFVKNKNILKDKVIFIEFYNITVQELDIMLKKAHGNVAVFIITSRKYGFHCVDLELIYGVTILFKEDLIHTLKNKIKLTITSETFSECNKDIIKYIKKSIKLTHCQQQVIDLVNYGFSGATIAIMLNKSEKTISGHKRSAMKKMGVLTNIGLHKLRNVKL